MDKNKWISNKVEELMSEGKAKNQATAIAFSMYENVHQPGGRQKEGNMFTDFLGSLGSRTWNQNPGKVNNESVAQQPSANSQNSFIPNFEVKPMTPYLWKNSPQVVQTKQVAPTTQSVKPTAQEVPAVNSVQQYANELKPSGVTYGTTAEQLQSSVKNIPSNLTQSTNSNKEEYVQHTFTVKLIK